MPKNAAVDENRYSEIEHISYQIERFEKVIRQHLLAQNLVTKQYLENDENTIENGIFKFNTNRKYYDSLDSTKILRTQQPMKIVNNNAQEENNGIQSE
jgi:hypothetical protein